MPHQATTNRINNPIIPGMPVHFIEPTFGDYFIQENPNFAFNATEENSNLYKLVLKPDELCFTVLIYIFRLPKLLIYFQLKEIELAIHRTLDMHPRLKSLKSIEATLAREVLKNLLILNSEDGTDLNPTVERFMEEHGYIRQYIGHIRVGNPAGSSRSNYPERTSIKSRKF